jgi:hypothetical protein
MGNRVNCSLNHVNCSLNHANFPLNHVAVALSVQSSPSRAPTLKAGLLFLSLLFRRLVTIRVQILTIALVKM